MWKKILSYFLDLFKEPSTYLAIFNFFAYIGINIKPELKTVIQSLCLSVDALIVLLVSPYLKSKFKEQLADFESLKQSIKSAKTEQQFNRIQKNLD